jgi:transcriptional regulator with XRE-family HTH domain
VALSENTDRADPITRLLGKRVAELRKSIGINQTELGARMTKLRPGWSRSTVVKLERNKRESISLQDWLALAGVLGVPPVWLLVDPKAGTPVPIAGYGEVDPWTALLWLTGSQPLEDPGGDAWANAYSVLRPLVTLARLLESYRLLQRVVTGDVVVGSGPVDMGHWETAEASKLQSIANELGQFRALQLPVPQVPPDVRKRAVELGIELPGQEG